MTHRRRRQPRVAALAEAAVEVAVEAAVEAVVEAAENALVAAEAAASVRVVEATNSLAYLTLKFYNIHQLATLS